MDPRFKVQVVRQTSDPQLACWLAAHRDYSEELSVLDIPPEYMPENETVAGKKLIGMILNKGHFGVLEHPHITLECSGFPHDVAMQARTHRVPYSFDVQSQRYTGQRVIKFVENHQNLFDSKESSKELIGYFSPECKGLVAGDVLNNINELKDIFYVRPTGTYTDRQGKKFDISEYHHRLAYSDHIESAYAYEIKVNEQGWSEEIARHVLNQGIRQGFFMTTNVRGLMHFLDMRSKADAQLEIQWLCELIFEQFKLWVPEVAAWYEKKRLGKNKLAP